MDGFMNTYLGMGSAIAKFFSASHSQSRHGSYDRPLTEGSTQLAVPSK